MLKVPAQLPVWLAVKPIDMRKSFDGSSVYATSFLQRNPLNDGLFIFRNNSGDKIKLMYWHRNGLVIVHKRLERGRFKWPKHDEDAMFLTRQEHGTLAAVFSKSRLA
ncbi:IS66 family insertion sequence element accessory protein TnpB [Teredinibacter haidensis]|uniref:IS66 family insertion sequence element accessory protein TnpB n=1 Tax=Teredinibacter haidensis TaxID=2731755 RepID=UPI000948BD71|nr:IS66 family insertion sequence element accessory protein TnpB [Teredinibacter haidensis]